MLTLHNLENKKSAKHRRKRVGRGNASGMGTYSTRGLKGQKSRSGGKSGLAVRSIKSYLLRIPKVRGFKALTNKMAVVNIGDLDRLFKDKQKINARDMLKVELIHTIGNGVKVLAQGKITKALIVEANAFSKDAMDKINKAGGKAVVVGNKEVKPKEKSAKAASPVELQPKEDNQTKTE